MTNLIVRKRSIFVDRVNLRYFRPDRFAFEHSFLLTFRKQRYFIVYVFQHNVYGCFRSQLLSTVVL